MARYGMSGVRHLALRLLFFTLPPVLWLSPALAAPSSRVDAKAKVAAATAAQMAEITQRLDALADAQRTLAMDLGQLHEQLTGIETKGTEAQDAIRQGREEGQSTAEQVKGMREEVRGLYVESSGLKGDIAQVGKRVDDLDTNLSNFRLSAGIVVAVVIVLQIVLMGLMFRGRG